MKFFIDTANVDEIRKANDMGVICGVTTNPSLIAKEGKDYVETLKEIASIVDGPISGEVKATTTDAEGMIAEGREIAKIHPNMVVKIPMTVEGLKATKVLASEGIQVNVTLIFSATLVLQLISDILPARWYIQAVRKLMIEGVDISFVWSEVSILALMAVLLITISFKKFKNRL